MKANLSQKEPGILEYWKEINLYQLIQNKNKGKPSFNLHDGPPYANGPIHLGHTVNKILKDIIIKTKNFSGYSAPYVPGWDCHGLPIELNVEKNMERLRRIYLLMNLDFVAEIMPINKLPFKKKILLDLEC